MQMTSYQAGATDVSVVLRAFTTATGAPRTDITHATAGLELRFKRGATGALTTITAATQTATGAHADGGIVHTHAGVYRVDLPDAAVASGAPWVVVTATVADVTFTVATVEIVDGNPRGAAITATAIRDAILTWEPYTGYSLARLLRAMGIVLRGTATGLATTSATYTAPAGAATVTATVDANGNRSVVSDTASGTP